ncbi:MAG: hypothetical protein ABIH25_05650 [Candidatus Woesearchaeota archaeon]
MAKKNRYSLIRKEGLFVTQQNKLEEPKRTEIYYGNQNFGKAKGHASFSTTAGLSIRHPSKTGETLNLEGSVVSLLTSAGSNIATAVIL